MKTKYKPEIGKKYGTWTIISEEVKQGGILHGSSNRTAYWRVICDCGREAWRSAYNLITDGEGKTCKSCAKLINKRNPFLKYYLNRVEKRAEKINVEYNIDMDYVLELFFKQKERCSLSGLKIYIRKEWHNDKGIEMTASIDRIDNKKGYIKGNIQWVHKNINFMKGTMTEKDFIETCRMVSDKHK